MSTPPPPRPDQGSADELAGLAGQLGTPVDVWVCPETGDVHALVLVDVGEPAPRPARRSRRRSTSTFWAKRFCVTRATTPSPPPAAK